MTEPVAVGTGSDGDLTVPDTNDSSSAVTTTDNDGFMILGINPFLPFIGNPCPEGILEPHFDKRLESFALCYSQSLLLADFSPSYSFLRLEFSTATAEGGIFHYVCLIQILLKSLA